MDEECYLKEGDRQLSDEEVYEPVESIPWDELTSRLEYLGISLKRLLHPKSGNTLDNRKNFELVFCISYLRCINPP